VAARDVAACPTTDAFQQKLVDSLVAWKESGKRGVWLEVPAKRSELIAAAQSQGFEFHHAERDYLMMNLWLGEGESLLPANASHSVGVGILVLNKRGELLVVQEATGPAANRKGGFWKVPTGLVNAGEEMSVSAVREMKEETGIDVEFVQLVGCREMQRALHGKGNLFFMCVCRLVGSDEIRIQKEELAAAKWMPLDEFESLPYYQGDSVYSVLTKTSVAAVRGQCDGLQRLRLPVAVNTPKRGEQTIYVPAKSRL